LKEKSAQQVKKMSGTVQSSTQMLPTFLIFSLFAKDFHNFGKISKNGP
jgi:hypothetical protein